MQEWKGNSLPPHQYEWKKENGYWSPEQGYGNICPKAIASMLKWNCKTACKSMACSCKKSGVDCTECCKCPEDCQNQHKIQEFSIDSDDSSVED